MRTFAAVAFAVGIAALSPAHAQSASASGSVSFNLFNVEGWQTSRIFTFDDDYTAQFGIPVPVPYRWSVPMNDAVFMIADGQPDGGAFVKFTFGAETENPEDRFFLENIQIATATIPLYTDREDPGQTRVAASAQLLRDTVFPTAVQGFQDPEILAIEEIPLGSVGRAVHLIGTYVDPSIGPMMIRLVMMPHPDRPEGYFAVININLSAVPVSDGDTLAATITGQMLSSWEYR